MKDTWKSLTKGLFIVNFITSTAVGSIIMGFFLGRFIDENFSTSPFGRVGGVILGIVSGAWAIKKQLYKEMDKKGNDE